MSKMLHVAKFAMVYYMATGHIRHLAYLANKEILPQPTSHPRGTKLLLAE